MEFRNENGSSARRITEIEKLKKIIGKQTVHLSLKNSRTVDNRLDIADELIKTGHSIKESCELAGLQRSNYYANQKEPKQKIEKSNSDDENLIETIKVW